MFDKTSLYADSSLVVVIERRTAGFCCSPTAPRLAIRDIFGLVRFPHFDSVVTAIKIDSFIMDFLTESGELSPSCGKSATSVDTLDGLSVPWMLSSVPADKRKGCIMDLCVHRMEVASGELASLLVRQQSLICLLPLGQGLLLSLSL